MHWQEAAQKGKAAEEQARDTKVRKQLLDGSRFKPRNQSSRDKIKIQRDNEIEPSFSPSPTTQV